MSSLRRVFAPWAALLVLGAVRGASAQTTAAASVALSSTQPAVHQIARSGFRTNDQINYADCINDDVITFNLLLSANHLSYGLEIWAGSGCDNITTRTTPTSTLCWKLAAESPPTTTPGVAIHVRDILYGPTILKSGGGTTTDTDAGTTDTGGTSGSGGSSGGGGTDTGGSAGTTTAAGGTSTTTTVTLIPTGTVVSNVGPESCEDTSGLPVVSPLTIYFMLVDGSSAIAGTFATYVVHYKLLAPDPPVSVTADIGDTLLPIHFNYGNNQSTDPTINGYQFYCDPPPGSAALADAGIMPVPASDAGDSSAALCQVSTNLIPGKRANDKYKCGTASVSATAGNATGLVNGVAYNVGVAATDTYQNVGNISDLACKVPQPVTGFFKAYRAAGGQAGGGFCSFSPKREPLPLLAVLGLASCLVLRRRRAA